MRIISLTARLSRSFFSVIRYKNIPFFTKRPETVRRCRKQHVRLSATITQWSICQYSEEIAKLPVLSFPRGFWGENEV
jgi:hypothetical protein